MQGTGEVKLSLSSYNQIKAENTRFQMFLSRMMESAALSEDKSRVIFDTDLLTDIIHLIYPEMYKKKLGQLRSADAVEAVKCKETVF